MARYSIPYGQRTLRFSLPRHYRAQWYPPPQPLDAERNGRTDASIRAAIRAFLVAHPQANLGSRAGAGASGAIPIAIAINDATRPPIQKRILPLLIPELEHAFASPLDITLYIANGLHPPAGQRQTAKLIPPACYRSCRVVNHDATRRDALTFLGHSRAGSPVWVNSAFHATPYRIAISAVTGHQFAGVSGGAKMIAIGLAGAATITHNHSLYTKRGARLGEIAANPVRADIDEIGRMIGGEMSIDCALNAEHKIIDIEIFDAHQRNDATTFARFSASVMDGSRVESSGEYDGVIVGGGGYPRDDTLYQLQKALAHAAPLAKPNAPIILCGACKNGVGDTEFQRHFTSAPSVAAAMARQQREVFRIGPHKSALFARDMNGRAMALVSTLRSRLVSALHFTPLSLNRGTIARFFARAHSAARISSRRPRIAIVPSAPYCYFNGTG